MGFRHMLLYLEWAPVKAFKTAPPPSKKNQSADDKESVAATTTSTENTESTTRSELAPEEDDDEPEPETTLFVKNLNFSTTDGQLKEHFCECGSIFSAIVAKKKDPKNPGQVLSMGYGFIQFREKKAANTALKTLQNTKLDGHVIELKRSNRTSDGKDDVKATSRKTSKNQEPISSKLLVRNVAFEAKTKEVAELFKPFGELKSVRMPRKRLRVFQSVPICMDVVWFWNGLPPKTASMTSEEEQQPISLEMVLRRKEAKQRWEN